MRHNFFPYQERKITRHNFSLTRNVSLSVLSLHIESTDSTVTGRPYITLWQYKKTEVAINGPVRRITKSRKVRLRQGRGKGKQVERKGGGVGGMTYQHLQQLISGTCWGNKCQRSRQGSLCLWGRTDSRGEGIIKHTAHSAHHSHTHSPPPPNQQTSCMNSY